MFDHTWKQLYINQLKYIQSENLQLHRKFEDVHKKPEFQFLAGKCHLSF